MNFTELSDELILLILSFMDIPELLNFSRTTRHHRALTHDPLLHRHRLMLASFHLQHSLSHRPSLSSLHPPSSTIYLTTTHVLARTLSRQLVAIRLNRNLSRRPSATSLVKHNILPVECCSVDRRSGEYVLGGKGAMSPGILEVKRRVEREVVKDGLRGWLGKRVYEGKIDEREEDSSRSVRGLVRRFTARFKTEEKKAPGSGRGQQTAPRRFDEKWGPQAKKRREEPTRAHVYGLRRFWEGMARGQEVRV